MQVEPLQDDANIDTHVEDDSSPSIPEDANDSDSSSGESEAEEHKSTFEIIQEAIDEDAADDNEVEDLDQDTTSETEEDLEDTSEETVNTDETDENIEDELPTEFHEHPRFKELIAQKNEFKERIAELESRTSEAEQKASLYDAIGDDNMNLYADFLTAMDSDPRKALQIIKPTIDRLVQEAGLSLSPELKRRVEDGELTEEEAKERMELEAENAALKRRQKRDEETNTQQQQQQAQKAFFDSAISWEKTKKLKDPDYAKIQRLFSDSVVASVQREGPPALADVPAFLEKIYADVKAQVGGTQATKKIAKRVVKGSPSPKKGQEQRAYSSTYDIVSSIIGS